MKSNLLSGLSTRRLRRMLRGAEAAFGPNSPTANAYRRAVAAAEARERCQADRKGGGR